MMLNLVSTFGFCYWVLVALIVYYSFSMIFIGRMMTLQLFPIWRLNCGTSLRLNMAIVFFFFFSLSRSSILYPFENMYLATVYIFEIKTYSLLTSTQKKRRIQDISRLSPHENGNLSLQANFAARVEGERKKEKKRKIK